MFQKYNNLSTVWLTKGKYRMQFFILIAGTNIVVGTQQICHYYKEQMSGTHLAKVQISL